MVSAKETLSLNSTAIPPTTAAVAATMVLPGASYKSFLKLTFSWHYLYLKSQWLRADKVIHYLAQGLVNATSQAQYLYQSSFKSGLKIGTYI